MFVRNAWYVAAWSDELSRSPLSRRLCDQPVVLFRDAHGQAAALEDRCCHCETPLQLGEVVATGLQCGCDGLVFDRSGRCVEIPGQTRIPAKARVHGHPLQEHDGVVWIWMGDVRKAARVALPSPGSRHRTVDRVAAGYLMLAEILVDTARPQGRAWRQARFEAPSCVVQDRADLRLFHGLTPETETSCHHFWSADFDAAQAWVDGLAGTLARDHALVEGRQRRSMEAGSHETVAIDSDAVRGEVRRSVDRLLSRESTSAEAGLFRLLDVANF